MEVITSKTNPEAKCSFCEALVDEWKFMFKMGTGTMCPSCVREIKELMDESIKEANSEPNHA